MIRRRPWLLLKLGDQTQYDWTKLREMHRHDVLKPTVVEMLVVVPQHIANANDCVPGNFGRLIPQLRGQSFGGLGDDLQCPFGRAA